MKSQIVNYDVVLIKKGLENSLVSLDDVRSSVVRVTEDISPVITQFPDLLAIAVPNKQLSVVIRKDSIIVSNTSTKIDEAGALLITKMAIDINDVLKNSLNAYGLNHHISFEFSPKAKARNFLSALDTSNLSSGGMISSKKIAYASFTVGEIVGGHREQLQVAPKVDENLKYTGRVDVSANTHFVASELPMIDTLQNEILKYYRKSVGKIESYADNN